ncbi:ribose 5-phosphate isomerase B [Sporolactobacillus shoreicorticis]|nr:ribose 5-phosphate isomerase B [Sporolactobacillus shoreicorticis]
MDYLKKNKIEIIDEGTFSAESTDYPIYADKVALDVVSKKVDLGILICGTGIGISIVANKVRGIRAVACSEPYSAKMSHEHNNANILAFGSRVVGCELAKMIVDAWLGTEFQGGKHQRRVDLITCLEKKQQEQGALNTSTGQKHIRQD